MGLTLVGVLIAIIVCFGYQLINHKNHKSSSQTSKVSFQIPSNCHVDSNPLVTSLPGFDLNYAKSWKFNTQRYHEQGFGFVVVLYPDTKEKTLKAAVHMRSKSMKTGPGQLGLPGGHVDDQGETLIEGALRELKEEAMQGQNSIKTSDLHWISASKYNLKGGDRISGLFVLFVNDTKAITGPMKKSAGELEVDSKQGFDKTTRHRFVKWRFDATTGHASISNNDNPGLTAPGWNSTLKSLSTVSKKVHCTWN